MKKKRKLPVMSEIVFRSKLVSELLSAGMVLDESEYIELIPVGAYRIDDPGDEHRKDR